MGLKLSCCKQNDAAATTSQAAAGEVVSDKTKSGDTTQQHNSSVSREHVSKHLSDMDMEETPENLERAGSVYFDAFEDLEDLLEYAPAAVENPHPRLSISLDHPSTLLKKKQRIMRRTSVSVRKWLTSEPRKVSGTKRELSGYPGELTTDELEATLEFRAALETSEHPEFREMVDCFLPVEEEPYALCRFMRSKKFVVEEIFEDIAGCVEPWHQAKAHDFYPTCKQAVHCPPGVFLTQYPSMYYGNARNGCPVGYLFAGGMSVEGLECLTDLDSLTKYTWFAIMHQFKQICIKSQEEFPDKVIRCEAVSIIDLSGLGRAQLNSRTLDTLKQVITVTKCFPELLNRMVIVNAPYFFALAWPVIKKLVDPRTADKIEIFASLPKASKRLSELVDPKWLLKEVGGQGPSFQSVVAQEGVARQEVHLVTQQDTYKVELYANEVATIHVYTRSQEGGTCTLEGSNGGSKKAEVDIVNPNPSDPAATATTTTNGNNDSSVLLKPYCTIVASDIEGPSKWTLRINANSKETKNYFLIYVEIKKK